MSDYLPQNDDSESKKGDSVPKGDEMGEKDPSIAFLTNLVKDFDKAIEDEWLPMAEESWQEFKRQDPSSPRTKKSKMRRYQLWYATNKVRQPLLFSRVPEPVSQPLLEDKTGFLKSVAGMAEKLGKVALEQFPFFSVARSAVDDLLITNLGTSRLMMKAEFCMEPKKDFLELESREIEGPDGQVIPQEYFVNSKGEEVPAEAVRYDHEGNPYIELPEMMERVKKQKATLKPICYKDFIWDYEAKEFSEWEYGGFRSRMSRRQIVKRFGKEALQKLAPLDPTEKKDEYHFQRKTELIELWYEPTKKCYIFELGGRDFIKVSKNRNPLGLEQFFPFVYPLFDNLTTENSVPFTEYGCVRDNLDHIHDLFDKMSSCVRLARPRALYDNSVPELKKNINKSRTGDYIGVANLAAKAQRGQTFVLYLDTAPIIAALKEFQAAFDREIAAYDQLTGFSDVVRGITNPYESATATERKSKWAVHRMIGLQEDVQRWCRDNIKMLIDAILSNFESEQIFEMLEPSLTQMEKKNFKPMLDKLKSDQWRSISIEIETDSTILTDEDAHKQQAIELTTALGNYMSQVATASKDAPEMLPIAIRMMEYVIGKFRGGKEFQEEMKQMFMQVIQASQQRAMQQAQAQQNDPKQLKLQLEQRDQQLKEFKTQSEEARKMRELQLKEFAEQHDQAVDKAKLNIAALKEQFEAQYSDRELSMEERKQALNEFIEKATLELRQVMESLSIQEKFMEEQRLANKQDVPNVVVIPMDGSGVADTQPMMTEPVVTDEYSIGPMPGAQEQLLL